MEKGLDKLLRRLVLKKYPMYLDIRVIEDSGIGYVYSPRNKCYEVFLITFEEEYNEDMYVEVRDYVYNLAKYMDVELCGVWRQVVTEEQWEKINSGETPSW
jgi:hypothetical protein